MGVDYERLDEDGNPLDYEPINGSKTPYNSVGSRPTNDDLSLEGRARTTMSGDDEEAEEAPPVGPPPTSNPLVPQTIQQRAAPTPPMPPGASKDYSQDPMMLDYNKREQDLQEFRRSQIQSNLATNLARAGATAAQGANAPKGDQGFYSDIEKQNKELLTGAEGDLGRRQRIVNAIEARNSREGVAADNRAAREAALKAKLAEAGGRASDKADAKLDQQVNKWTTQMKDDLDPNKARGGNLASNQKRVDNADRVQALLEQVHNNPDPRQMEELAISTQALLSASGTPAAEQVKALIPKSALGDVNKFKEWISNNPTGTGQQAFVQRMAETVSREKAIAQGQVQKAQTQRLSAYGKFKDADPDTYNAILNSYGLGEQPDKASPKSAGAPSGKAGQLVKVKDPSTGQMKTYRVGEDGDSLEEVM
jgi:hypothetical protein